MFEFHPHNPASPASIASSGIHESDKPTKNATRIDIGKVDAQNLRSVIVSVKDSFRINTCRGRLIVQINNMVTVAIKIDSTTNSFETRQ